MRDEGFFYTVNRNVMADSVVLEDSMVSLERTELIFTKAPVPSL